jgi:chromate reductase
MSTVVIIALLHVSLGKESINRMVPTQPRNWRLPVLDSIIEIGHLPIYNQDGVQNPPAAWMQFRDRIRDADAILFVTPEQIGRFPLP